MYKKHTFEFLDIGFYIWLSKSSAMVIVNFISQLTFSRLFHEEIVESIIYNHLCEKSMLDLVRGFFQINFHLNQKEIFKQIINSIDVIENIRTIL